MKHNKIDKKKIMVVGDVMLDVYIEGTVKRISPEAPVPVLLKKSERYVLGGASNVASNLVAANQSVSVVSVIGNDIMGKKLVNSLQDLSIDCSLILESDCRRTTTKTRLMGQNYQQIVRLDEEDNYSLQPNEEERIYQLIKKNIKNYDLIILSDYLKGVLTESLTSKIISLANYNSIKVLADVKDKNIKKYKNTFLIKPNKKELSDLTGRTISSDIDLVEAAILLKKECNCNYVLVTCGGEGMQLIGEEIYPKVSCATRQVYDVSGAGDTVISYMGVFLANDYEVQNAVKFSNDAAGIKVSKVGTAPVTIEELGEYLHLNDLIKEKTQKIMSINDSKTILVDNLQQKIVFTNGCFDILHYGHISYLQKAASFGDKLIVGLNSDNSVRRLKGESRPINNQNDRAAILAALECVDYVVIFDEDTPINLIEEIKPDILVKGADYKPEEVVGKDLVESYGGQLHLVSFVDGHSTTNIINKMRGE